MHKHCSCKLGEQSWREDASLFNTIIVWDLTGELVVYHNSHCPENVMALILALHEIGYSLEFLTT